MSKRTAKPPGSTALAREQLASPECRDLTVIGEPCIDGSCTCQDRAANHHDHMAHCNQGEWVGVCKFARGQACPALMPAETAVKSDRLAWVRRVTGYDEGAPGALFPRILRSDGGLEDETVWWEPDEDSINLNGRFLAEELDDFVHHMRAVETALWRKDCPPPSDDIHETLSHIRSPGRRAVRTRLAGWLLSCAVRAAPKGEHRRLLCHLRRFWWEKRC